MIIINFLLCLKYEPCFDQKLVFINKQLNCNLILYQQQIERNAIIELNTSNVSLIKSFSK